MNIHARRPLISVIVAVYNGATMQQCIDSVASQTFQDVEVVVVDGGSTDGTLDPLMTNAPKLGYWISEPDKGIYNAWNKALHHARGEWICFLGGGADDYLWSNDALAQMAMALKTLPGETQIAYGRVMLLGLDHAPLYLVGESYDLKPGQRVDVMGLPPRISFDYAWYSSFGLRALLECNGFRIIEHRKLLADASVLFQLGIAYLWKFFPGTSPMRNLFFTGVFVAPLTLQGLLVGCLLPRNPDLFLDQLVVAKKLS